jgi:hypothetical protein
MDGVALASVITSGVLGLSSVVASVYNAHRAARTAIAVVAAQRRSDAYLELLRLVERRGEHLAARVNNIQQRDQEDHYYFTRPVPDVAVMGLFTSRLWTQPWQSPSSTPTARRVCEVCTTSGGPP